LVAKNYPKYLKGIQRMASNIIINIFNCCKNIIKIINFIDFLDDQNDYKIETMQQQVKKHRDSADGM
jgi:hypothetical protein